MNSTQSSFIGIWNASEADDQNEVMEIEQTGETYKCSWRHATSNAIGIGMLVENKLLISRIAAQDGMNTLPNGGIGLYRPIGDKRSNCALWASMENFNLLGSGIALRQETTENFEGVYTVRYFQKEHESPIFDLKINRNTTNEFYKLTWSVGEKLMLHGIGAITNANMALAWGQLDMNWELVILSFDTNDGNCIKSNRISLANPVMCEEIFVRK